MPETKTLPHPQPTRGGAARVSLPGDPIINAACPYLERDDPRCATRFSLGRLEQMMDVCLGAGVAGCFMHHRIRHEDATSSHSRPVIPTHDGHPLRLRPTGS
jgi:hypothetical protein